MVFNGSWCFLRYQKKNFPNRPAADPRDAVLTKTLHRGIRLKTHELFRRQKSGGCWKYVEHMLKMGTTAYQIIPKIMTRILWTSGLVYPATVAWCPGPKTACHRLQHLPNPKSGACVTQRKGSSAWLTLSEATTVFLIILYMAKPEKDIRVKSSILSSLRLLTRMSSFVLHSQLKELGDYNAPNAPPLPDHSVVGRSFPTPVSS